MIPDHKPLNTLAATSDDSPLKEDAVKSQTYKLGNIFHRTQTGLEAEDFEFAFPRLIAAPLSAALDGCERINHNSSFGKKPSGCLQ